MAYDASLEHLIFGESPAIRRVRALVARIAPTNLPVLIHGPTGAGKELVAQALHAGSRRSGRFVAFNVCAIADAMFEDALFGHVRGAFTGATADSAGYLLEADRGTAFLDEISGLPLAAQAKLLRAVETKEFRPVGGRTDRRSDFRIVVATNEDLRALAAAGRFREDLLFRLSGAVVEVPGLDARPEDIPLLARRFAAQALSMPPGMEAITADAVAVLERRAWPGNVRELRQVVECAAALVGPRQITRDAILDALGLRATAPAGMRAREEFAERRLLAVLAEHQWDVTAAASALGVHRATVYRRLNRMGAGGSTGATQSVAGADATVVRRNATADR